MKSWFPFFALACAAAAAGAWFLFPQLGAWPLLVGLAPWAVRAIVAGRPLPLTGFELPLAVFLGTAGLAVWSAYDREAAWAKFWLIAGAVLLFYAFAELATFQRSDDNAPATFEPYAAWLLAGFGAAVAVYFVATHDWDAFPGKVAAINRLGRALQAPLPPLPGDRLHPNLVGGVLAFVAPFAAAAATFQRSAVVRFRRLNLPGAVLLALILFGLALTNSRGAWLALGAAAALAAFWWALGLLIPAPARRGRLFAGMLLTLGLLLLITLTLQRFNPFTLLDRLPGGAGLGRLTLYRNGLALAGDYPFIGAGLGGFMMVYSTYQFLLNVGFSTHAHNLFLDIAVEQGLFAVAALLAMWGVFLVALWREERENVRTCARSHVTFAAALSLLTIALHGMVDDAFYGSRAVILLFLPLAFAVPAVKGRPVGLLKRLNLLLATLPVLAIVAVALVPSLRAAWYANLGAVVQGRTELSVYAWPEWVLQDAVRRERDLGEAMGYYERALALDPDNFSANRRLGQIALSLGEFEAALAYLEVAYAQTPWDNATRQLLGEALIVNGKVAAGRELWGTVNNAQNQLGARAFWYRHIGDEERRAAIEGAVER